MKRIIALCILALSVAAICFGQTNQTESFTITTYYPSPSGAYTNIRLSPTNDTPSGTILQPGVMYYNRSADMIRYANQTKGWVDLTGGSIAGGNWLYNSTAGDINNNNTNGSVIISGVGPNGELLQVNGDMRMKHPSSDTQLYLTRNTQNNTTSLIFKTWTNINDSYKIGMSRVGYKNGFRISNSTKDFIQVNTTNGRVCISCENAQARLHISGIETGASPSPDQTLLKLEGDGETRLAMKNAHNTGGVYEPTFMAFRHRGFSPILPVIKNDTLFLIQGNGYNGTAYPTAGQIQFSADGDFNATSTPGRISFFTTPAFSTVPVERFTMKNDAKVGIGATDPQYLFQVGIGAGEGHVSDTGAWVASSDKRFKKNISPIENALAQIIRVQGIRYDPITETSSVAKKGKYFGFIGQELEKVLPELVETDREGYKSVAYGSITPVLVEAIKVQQKDIESLRKEIEAFKAQE